MTTKRPGIDIRLQEGERVLRRINPSRMSYWLYYLIGILALPMVPIGMLILHSNWLIGILTLPITHFGVIIILYIEFGRIRANRFYITNKRVIHKFTFLSKSSSSVKYSQITDVHYMQGAIGRMFNYGTVHINTAGTTFMEILFFGVDNPEEVEEQIEKRWHKKSKK